MKLAFAILISLHGLIHLLGIWKGFHPSATFLPGETIVALSRSFSLLTKVMFATGCAGFLVAAAGVLFGAQWWWKPAIITIILSQVLIVLFWKEAKWGTIANVLILLPSVVAFATQKFETGVNREVDSLLSAPPAAHYKITSDHLAKLPASVQKWLVSSGVVGQEIVQFVRLKQSGFMRLKPESGK